MKRNYSNKILILLLLLFTAFSCSETKESNPAITAHQHNNEGKYTCPMHPQIIRDKPGTCPICGMDLVPMSSSNELIVDSNLLPLLKPVNEQVISTMPTITAESGTKIHSVPVQGIITYDTRKQVSISSRVAGRIESMYIKYNFQPVSKGQLIMEIYSPDLAAAQRELIYINNSDNNAAMLQSAKQRLSLLGMQPAQIAQVIKTGKPLYRVPVYSNVSGYIVEKNVANQGVASSSSSSSGGMNAMDGAASTATTVTRQPVVNQTPVVTKEGQYVSAGEAIFTIYEANNMIAAFSLAPPLAAHIEKGQKLIFHTVANANDIKTGIIGLIEPVQRNGENFTIVRVYLRNTDLQPGQLLTANIPIVTTGAYWLPENAVVQLGRKAVVFKKEHTVFIPKEVQTGIRANGMVQIIDNIAGWPIAKNASFLVDSESFIRFTSNQSK
ncbi:efflux RND transporter periplasmic adaptor subunit [Agriterribacter sp.]|uniref:efflux RND transporter periplasmic adaptor subunit n=1 Tax=Agriterribacter sp. TaxID=2821509 RepID=UPI002B6093B9|nr:efflux RND transporter periplasmic adaptor subunit [Agriterribacter sp.]HTN07922.1 efflux RND transporter periplasmic adaptor subunit [Agriterribacter sp.]